MDLRQLAAIAAVAEAVSFSAAARHLHTGQSNVSTHIARLERELGPTLVDRTTGPLTDEGEVVDATPTSLGPRVVNKSLDLGVVNLPLADPELATEPLFDEDRVLVVPHGHPLADCEHVELRELADHELMLEPRGTPFRDELDQQAAAAGVAMRAQAEIDGIGLLAS